MFKRVFGVLFRIISKPAKAWSILNEEKDTNNESFLKGYLYPLFGIISLLTFIGEFISKKDFSLEIALKNTIKISISVFLGFYLASFLLNELVTRMFHQGKQIKICQRFVGYSSALIYALYIVLALLPEFFFLRIFIFYTIYIIWEGAGTYMNIDESKKLNFTIFASLIILISPNLIEMIMYMTMPGLRN